MKTLAQLFHRDGFYQAEDFINRETLEVDYAMLAYDLNCHLRSLEPYRNDSEAKSLELIRNYFEAVANAARGKLK